MHEELLTHLALLGELKVVSRTSVMEYRDSRKNIRQIAAELGVRSLVEGSVRRAGNRVRVTAQLIDADSDTHAWGKSFDRDLTDTFAIQSELATEIARALKVTLSPEEKARIEMKPTENLAAYDLFLRHQELRGRTDTTTLASLYLKERIELISQAVALDPHFALAWARLGAEHALAYFCGDDRSSLRLAQAKHAIDRARVLAPNDMGVLIEEGKVRYYGDNDYDGAAESLERVLSVAPNNVEALTQVAFIHRRELRWKECAAFLERVLAVDPRNVKALNGFALFLSNFRHFERALEIQKRLVEVQPHDLSAQCIYHRIEYESSGSWMSFDRWRSSLPAGADQSSVEVHVGDVVRANARRDFDEVLRLLGSPPNQLPLEQRELLSLWTAAAYLAKGDRARATEAARTALPEVKSKLQDDPSNEFLRMVSCEYHAILGEREAALTEHRKANASALAKDLLSALSINRLLVYVHAYLGDREQTLQALSTILKLPFSSGHSFRIDWRLASLWDDPEFQAIVNDPANNAPLPFDLDDSYRMVELQTYSTH